MFVEFLCFDSGWVGREVDLLTGDLRDWKARVSASLCDVVTNMPLRCRVIFFNNFFILFGFRSCNLSTFNHYLLSDLSPSPSINFGLSQA